MFAKFVKMVRVGVPESAVREYMRHIGFDPALLDTKAAKAAMERARGPSASEEEARLLACQILGISVEAVDSAMFREMLLRTHPDKKKGGAEPSDEELFQRVKGAYDEFRAAREDA